MSKYLSTGLSGRTLKDTKIQLENAFQFIEDDINSNKANIEAALQTHKDSTTAHSAKNISFDKSGTNIVSTNTEAALKEVNNKVVQILATQVPGKDNEVLGARNSATKGKTFTLFGDRLEELEGDVENLKKPSYSTPIEITSSMINVLSNATYGQISGSLKSRTYTNLLGTHNTKNNLLLYAGGSNIFLDNTGGIGGTQDKKVNLIAGNVYFIRTDWLANTNNNVERLRMYGGTVIATGTIAGYATNIGLSSFLLFTAPATDSVSFAWRNNVADSNYYHDKSMILNLTTLGDTETDITKLAQKYNYVSGTKSTINYRIRSVGKNLFDGKNIAKDQRLNSITGQLEPSNATSTSLNFIRVKSNTTYSRSVLIGVSANTRIVAYDENKNFISLLGSTTTATTFTTPLNCSFIRLSFASDNTNVMFNEGSIALPYEEYKESIVYLPSIGNSVPNGTKDEINLVTGEKIQRTGELKLDGNLAWTFRENKTGFKIVNLPLSSMQNHGITGVLLSDENKIILTNQNGVRIQGYYQKNISSWEADTFSFFGSASLSIAINNTDSGWADAYTPTVTDIKNYFISKPYLLIYQLATEIKSKIDSILPLYCFAGGTIFIEPFYKDSASYNSGIAITNGIPIKSLESVTKIVGDVRTPVDLTKVTVASGGLSFTITGAVNTEKYEFVAEYDSSLSTLPSFIYSLPINWGATSESALNISRANAQIIVDILVRLKASGI